MHRVGAEQAIDIEVRQKKAHDAVKTCPQATMTRRWRVRDVCRRRWVQRQSDKRRIRTGQEVEIGVITQSEADLTGPLSGGFGSHSCDLVVATESHNVSKGPKMARVKPSRCRLQNKVLPSGEKHTPAISLPLW